MSEKKKKNDHEMSFLEHLEVLRWHIIRALVAILVVAIGVFLAKDFIFDTIIFGPAKETFPTYRILCRISEALCFSPANLTIFKYKLAEEFLTHIKVSVWLGLIAAFPIIFNEIWRFVKPGLYEKEVKVARGAVFVCSLLFMFGVLFGYFIIAPFAVSFLTNYSISEFVEGASTTITSYVNNMVMYTLPSGLIFELPVVIYFLSKVGLVYPSFLRQYRKQALVVILVLAAIITPPDPITQMLIAGPLYILYEISIHISKRVHKKDAEEEKGLKKT